MALARSLVKRPKLLLLDEPLGALDKKLREHTQFELVNIQERLGVTFVVVTHDQEEAMTLATRIGVMNRGRHRAGRHAARDLRVSRATRFVADFIGIVNMFEGRIDRGRARSRAHRVRRSWAAPIYVGHGVSAAPDAVVWAAVRPGEDRQLTREPPQADSDNVARGVGQGDRLHGRHDRLPRAARQRQDGARDPAERAPARRRHHLGRAGVAVLARVEPGGADE